MKLCIHVFVWVLLGMNLVLVEQSYAQQEQLSHSPQEIVTIAIDIEQVKQSITATKDRLEIAESMESAETASQLGVPLTRLQEYNANLRKIEAVYQRQLTSIERRDSLTREKEKLGKQLESQQESLIAQPSPYNLSFYDSLLDELTTVQQEEQTIIIVLKSEKKVFEEAKTKLEQAGHNVRAATEELQKVDQTDKSLQMSWRLEYAKVAEELAKALLDLQRMTVENAETELGLAQLKKQITQRHVNWVRSKLAFDQEDLYNHLDSLEERRITLQIRVDTLRQGQQDVESAWLEAQNEFEAAQSAEEAVKARAMAFLKAREAWRDTYQKVLEQTEIIQLILEQEKQFWQRRYGLLEKDVHYEELDSWEKQTSDYVQNIERNIRVKGKYQTNLQSEIAGIQKQLADEAISPDMKEQVETHMAALNKMAERSFEYLSLLQGTRAIGQRLLDEINLRQKDIALEKKIEGVGGVLQDIWEIELWVVDERSVTVRKLVIALFILVVGMWLARWFTHSVIRRILVKTRLDNSAVAAIDKMLYSFALLVFLVFALRFVNIPLTVFTFLGGAVAIGVGFGAQNLLNNFISGFILLAERPVKINDLIEVESNFGIIENIGMRCTRVRTPGNVHILVPNSSFLEKNIVNWTLSDQEIRAEVTLGVACNSDPHEVARLMLKAVYEHKKVLKTPEPIALFDEMNECALHFVVYFWVSMKSLQLLERRIIESDIRFRIVELFSKAGIEMANPQCDVHLDTSKPLELRVVSPEDVIGK
ncbi:MAG: mechanosensitive ion channel [Proteobacteria bacterium]|nr:mechanosensitive ion channel [Pseudomonadota bacterium]MBU1417241.1 mechanosensitive ion channel [Pseudomonadota bacterium]MBU1455984.1 mechanosensitive ion channel [Pseudomonadota bacterium]